MARDAGRASLAAVDGRVRRSERSREAIVQALLEWVGEGVLEPTAEQVAERAGVGIRTVFRHFSDMEGLFAAMDARIAEQAAPLLRAGEPDGPPAERGRELVRRRADLYERVAPYKRAADLIAWRSEFIRRQRAATAEALRRDLRRWLPELATAPADLADALEAASSFEAWDGLRQGQRLGRARAQAAMERAVLALLAGLEPD